MCVCVCVCVCEWWCWLAVVGLVVVVCTRVGWTHHHWTTCFCRPSSCTLILSCFDRRLERPLERSEHRPHVQELLYRTARRAVFEIRYLLRDVPIDVFFYVLLQCLQANRLTIEHMHWGEGAACGVLESNFADTW